MSASDYDPKPTPYDRLAAALNKLARAAGDQGATLEQALGELKELERRCEEARSLARRFYQDFLLELDWHVSEPPDPTLPTWLTEA